MGLTALHERISIPKIYRISGSRTFVRSTGRFRPPSETLKYRGVFRSPSNRFSSRLFFRLWQISTRSQKHVDRTFTLDQEILAEVLAEPARTRIVQSALGKLTSNKTVIFGYEPANSDSEPLTRCSVLLLSCYSFGFGRHRHHSGVLKPALGGNREYFHSQTIGDSDRLEPRGTFNFI